MLFKNPDYDPLISKPTINRWNGKLYVYFTIIKKKLNLLRISTQWLKNAGLHST